MSSPWIHVTRVGAVWALMFMLGAGTLLGQSISETLVQVRQLIAEGKLTEALDRLERALIDGTVLERENLVLQEEFQWQAAMAPLDFAQQLTYQDQFRAYAKRSVERWERYIDWYHQLTPDEREQLASGHNRINMATAHLGNAMVRMGQPSLFFDRYANIPDILYLGPDAIALWKQWLYACPEWVPAPERTAALRRRKICTEECKEPWLIYAETLEEWAMSFPLRESVRARSLREASQIHEASQSCGQ